MSLLENSSQKNSIIKSLTSSVECDTWFCRNPLLCVRPFSSVIYNVGLCLTAECCLCVGTRQALLQGWLLCVGLVCLANVPDLVALAIRDFAYFVQTMLLAVNDFFYFIFQDFLVRQIQLIF
jgi:hypothetical protein